jgi:3-hydroxymyristoyl/3-hydroxydecanoyl-(acyl carrier protein) dehydratase
VSRYQLDLGPLTLSLLSSVGPPALALDRVESVSLEPAPEIIARRTVALESAAVVGHFTTIPVLPSTAVLESAVQAGGLLIGFLLALRETSMTEDGARALVEQLCAFDRRARLLRPSTEASAPFAITALPNARSRTSVPASATVKFRRAVVPGDTMLVRLRATRELGELWHCEVESTVDGQVVLDGTIVLLVRALPAPRRELGEG